VAAAHPAFELLDVDRTSSAGADPTELVALGRTLADAWSWHELRRLCARSPAPFDAVPPEVARWCDIGAFSRLVLAGFAPLDDLVAAATDILPTPGLQRCRGVLAAWSLDPPHPPGVDVVANRDAITDRSDGDDVAQS
jgi:hypothetical protein